MSFELPDDYLKEYKKQVQIFITHIYEQKEVMIQTFMDLNDCCINDIIFIDSRRTELPGKSFYYCALKPFIFYWKDL